MANSRNKKRIKGEHWNSNTSQGCKERAPKVPPKGLLVVVGGSFKAGGPVGGCSNCQRTWLSQQRVDLTPGDSCRGCRRLQQLSANAEGLSEAAGSSQRATRLIRDYRGKQRAIEGCNSCRPELRAWWGLQEAVGDCRINWGLQTQSKEQLPTARGAVRDCRLEKS